MSINIYKLFFEQKDHLENDYYEEISDEVIAQEEKFGNLYKGRNVIWIGEKGRMVRASQEYTYPIDGNIFYDDKIQAVQRIIQDSNDNVYFYAPYGEASIITLDDIIESINYEEHNSHRAWTTDNEDLDEYIVNELDWIESNFYPDSSILAEDLLKFVNSNNLDAFREFLIKEEGWDEEDFKEGFEDAVNDLTNLKNLINEMEALKKEAVENNYGDLGEMAIQIRDGNHRTFGSFAAGEPYVWVMLSDNQMQDIKQEKSHVSSLSNIVESNTSGEISKNFLNLLSEQYFINENSERNITNILGYPAIISSIIQNNFGKNAFLIAKWFKEYKNIGNHDDKWFEMAFTGLYKSRNRIINLIRSLQALDMGEDEYIKTLQDMDYYLDIDEVKLLFSDEYNMYEHKKDIIYELEEIFLKEVFFSNSLIKAIKYGEVVDLTPYKNLSFDEAVQKFRTKKIFNNKNIIKSYENGFTWRDVGRKCELTAKAMKNCGSVNLMSNDKDATLLVLFDLNDKPHVIVTYSPNENIISSEQGGASSEVKEKYHNYVLDLVKHLNAEFNTKRSKSKTLSLKYRLESIIDPNSLKTIFEGIIDNYIEFSINGEKYITDSYKVIKQEDILEFKKYFNKNKDIIKNIFDDQPNENSYIRVAFSNSNFPSELAVKVKTMDEFINSVVISESVSIYKLFFINENEKQKELLNSFRQKLQPLIGSGLSGFGGNCGNAAIEINNKVFDGKGVLVAAVNKFIWEEYGQLVGHIAVYWPPSNTYWDIEGEKAWENIESWGMLDPEDDTWGEFLTEEDAYEVLRIELSEKDVRKHFDTCTYN